MFSRKDIESIDRTYFTVKSAGCYGITLQSKNTKHCWYITSEDYGNFQTCTIFHTHHEGTPMHQHGHGRNLKVCIGKIKDHDVYQIIKNSKKRLLARDRRRMARIEQEAQAEF